MAGKNLPMRYTQLRAFHHVALKGGFSRAAAALNQTQPAISDHVRLTEAGEGLFRLTLRFFETEEEVAAYLDSSRAAIRGRLRIVADSAAHVTDAIGRFRVAHPEAVITLWTGNSQEVLSRLRTYDAEIGVVGNLHAVTDLDRVELGQSRVVAIAAHGLIPGTQRALSMAELPRWPLVFRETGSRTRALLEAAAARAGVRLSPMIEVEGREAMREVVASGAGLGFLSEAEFGHDRRLRTIPLAGDGLVMSETLVSLSARRDVPVIRAFLKTVA
jgi:DNA-binding transcriptional LysR family regulator